MSTQLWLQWSADTEPAESLHWCLREQRKNGLQWHTWQSGGVDDLAAFVRSQPAGLYTVLVLNGDEVVTTSLPFEAAERKHLAKLAPFALEPTLAVDPAKVHLALQPPSAGAANDPLQVVVAYTDRQSLETRIQALEKLGLEVEAVYALPALLLASPEQWVLYCDSGLCHLNAPGLLCMSAEPDWLLHCIERALAARDSAVPASVMPAAVCLLAGDPVPLPIQEQLRASGIDVVSKAADNRHSREAWQTGGSMLVNLRQGVLAAPLRVGKYWQWVRLPVLAAALAFAATLLVTLTETMLDRQRVQQLETRIEQRYREVVPEGLLVDASQQLQAQIARLGAAAGGPGVVAMLHETSGFFAAHPSVQMHSMSYNHSRGGGAAELQMSISAPATADILALGEQLTAAGWSAQAQNISRTGDFQQASLLIRGKVL